MALALMQLRTLDLDPDPGTDLGSYAVPNYNVIFVGEDNYIRQDLIQLVHFPTEEPQEFQLTKGLISVCHVFVLEI